MRIKTNAKAESFNSNHNQTLMRDFKTNSGNKIKKQVSWALAVALAFTLTLGSGQLMGRAKASPAPGPLRVDVETLSYGLQKIAAPGNYGDVRVYVYVRDQNGVEVGGLTQNDFGIGWYYTPSGVAFGGNNKIVGVFSSGGGHYAIELIPLGTPWEEGDYLTGVFVNSAAGFGAAAAKLTVKCPSC